MDYKISKYNESIAQILKRYVDENRKYEIYDYSNWVIENPETAKTQHFIVGNKNKTYQAVYCALNINEYYGKKTCEMCFTQDCFNEEESALISELVRDFCAENNIHTINAGYDFPLYDKFELADISSTITPDGKYRFDGNIFYVTNEKYKNEIRDAFEHEYYEKNINDVKIEYINDAYKLKSGLNVYEMDKNNSTHYPGMHYFRPEDFFNKGDAYIVAKKNDHILGTLMFRKTETEQWVSYIDVGVPYREKGIATMMIKELDKHLDKSRPLELSSQSDMGRACYIANVFRKNISTEIKTNEIDKEFEKTYIHCDNVDTLINSVDNGKNNGKIQNTEDKEER